VREPHLLHVRATRPGGRGPGRRREREVGRGEPRAPPSPRHRLHLDRQCAIHTEVKGISASANIKRAGRKTPQSSFFGRS
jgi:hypothetical protein